MTTMSAAESDAGTDVSLGTACAAFFMEATYEVIIDPRDIPECCPPGQPPMYPPISSGDYLVQKYRETHASFEGPPDSAVDKPANGHASKA